MPASIARRRKSASQSGRTPAASRSKVVVYELIGLGLILLGLMLVFATFLNGPFPAALLTGVRYVFGTYGAWLVAVALIAQGVNILVHLSSAGVPDTSLGTMIICLMAVSLLQLTQNPVWNPGEFAQEPGGFIGGAIAGGLHRIMGQLAWLPLVVGTLCGISLITDMPLWMVLTIPLRWLYRITFLPLLRTFRVRSDSARREKVIALQQQEIQSRNKEVRGGVRMGAGIVDDETSEIPTLMEMEFDEVAVPAAVKSTTVPPIIIPDQFVEGNSPPPQRIVGVPSDKEPEQLQFAEDAVRHPDNRPYLLPPISMLSVSPKSTRQAKDDTDEKIVALEETLKSFGIEAKVVGVERGPRVTRFELVPPPGIRINRITNLADNIALSLAALDVRVEAPVPGKGVVGIEVPNKESVIVDLRDIIESEVMTKCKSPLAVALGRDITGHPRIADLTRMPHLLIAGATNSGKSVCINSLICSILMRATPQQVKFLMVDPKRVELSLFQSIPHLIAPVAYDAKHASGLLRWAIREMEQRYAMFAEKGVRNIIGFNEDARLERMEELPYIVIIIDELADLMMQAAAEFESSICRIAQLARATGIHLVVATQRPSVNVITGTIKANIPSRIAFAVAQQVDSRTILDMNGAERLVGQGDMLYLPVDGNKPTRIQGAYVTEKDINRIVAHVKAQGKPIFSDDIMAIEDEAAAGDGDSSISFATGEQEDEFFERALDFIRTTKYASTSMLQRKFRIGYTRAARMMDIFEERGFVGPGQGSKPREVIFAPSSSVVGRPVPDNFADDDEV